MELIGSSTLWVEKYRPQKFDDIICPEKLKTFLSNIKNSKDIPNLLFHGSAGTGKTTTAKAICNELDCTYLHLNCSLDNSINDIRYKVQSFASTVSLYDDKKKIAILDEMDRLSGNAMDSIKSLQEETESNCRYIFITNNVNKVIDPIISRTQQFSFGESEQEKKDLISQMFKRCSFILGNEKIEFDKKSLVDLIVKVFPDFRKTINTLQQYSMMSGKIDSGIMNQTDDSKVSNLLAAMKAMKFLEFRKIASTIDTNTFYSTFYDSVDEYLEKECIPNLIVLLAEYNFRDGLCNDREINLVAFLIECAKIAKWK